MKNTKTLNLADIEKAVFYIQDEINFLQSKQQ